MIEIRITSDPRFLVVVRAMLGKFCEIVACSEEMQRKIVLAVDEACANIMRHTYRGDKNQPIEILFKGGEERLEIVLRDCGPPVDVERVRPRNVGEVRPGGLGTHFIRSIMDEVEYGFEAGRGNVLRMVKHLPKR